MRIASGSPSSLLDDVMASCHQYHAELACLSCMRPAGDDVFGRFTRTIMSLAALRASNAKAFRALPAGCTGVFVGGTSGIGYAMAEAFASSSQEATVIIVGRNKGAAETLFNSLRASGTKGQYEFIECDATLMKNVKQAGEAILDRHSKIHFLVFTQGFMSFDGHTPTVEGIDRKLALNYYSRFRFIRDLLPALRKGYEEDGIGKVESVLRAGKGGPIDSYMDDLGLKDHYSTMTVARAAPTYNDLMMEVGKSYSSCASANEWQKCASLNPSLSFIHTWPGVVASNMLTSSTSTIISAGGRIFSPLVNLLFTSTQDSAQYMWHALHTYGAGTSRVGSRGEILSQDSYFGSKEQVERLWQHSETMTHLE